MSGDQYFLVAYGLLALAAAIRIAWGAALVLDDAIRGEPRLVWSPAADPPAPRQSGSTLA